MRINIEGQSLPAIYKRQGKECYLDPVRQKLIYITPEETVRQRMIAYLINELRNKSVRHSKKQINKINFWKIFFPDAVESLYKEQLRKECKIKVSGTPKNK